MKKKDKQYKQEQELLEMQRFASPKLFKRIQRVLIRPPSDLPNMPAFQRCPDCGRNANRESKTMGGARYNCLKHGIFFVKRS